MATDVFPQAIAVLDVYHAIEHVSDAAKSSLGEGSEPARTQPDSGREALLSAGKEGIERWLAQAFEHVPPQTSAQPLLSLAGYLLKHPKRHDYADRLAKGGSIGSGAVEGVIKQLLNLRLKRTGARWRAEHVGPLVELIALSDAPDCHAVWTAA